MSTSAGMSNPEAKQSGVLNQGETVGLLRMVATTLRSAKSEAAAVRFEQLAAEIESGVADEHRTARLEKYRSELAQWEAEVKYSLDWKLESFRATMALAQRAINSAMLINGAAAVALLAYLGNIKADGHATAAYVGPLMWFAGGVITAAITFVCSYLAQLHYTPGDQSPTAVRWHKTAIVVGLMSFAMFGGGAVSSYFAFAASAPAQFQASKPDDRRNAPPPKPPGPPGPPPAYQPQGPTVPTQQPTTQSPSKKTP